MILLNACSDVKIEFEDGTRPLFSLVLTTPTKDTEFNLMDDILVDSETAGFLKGISFAWVKDKDRVLAVRADVNRSDVTKFIAPHLVRKSEIFLDDE